MIKEDLLGAYTINEVLDILLFVAQSDFSGLYPSIMKQFNISPQCIRRQECHPHCVKFNLNAKMAYDKKGKLIASDHDEVEPHYIWFCRETINSYAKVIDTLLSKRRRYKKLMKEANQRGDDEMRNKYDAMQL